MDMERRSAKESPHTRASGNGKLPVKRRDDRKRGASYRKWGWVLMVFAAIYLLMGVTGELRYVDGSPAVGATIMMTVLCGGGGWLCLRKGADLQMRAQRYERYVSIVRSGGDALIDRIAAAYPTTYEQAVTDLQAMLRMGYFADSYVDLERRELVMPERMTAPVRFDSSVGEPEKETAARVIQCPHCGAVNTVRSGAVKECEYCGSPIAG